MQTEMFDRLLERATALSPDYFGLIHVVLSATDYATLSDRLLELFKITYEALQQDGTLRINKLPPTHRIQLKLTGFSLSDTTDDVLVATKPPKSAANASVPLAVPLPRRNVGLSKEAKKALWTLKSDSPKIDTETLIIPEDRIKPVCEPITEGNKARRKKACKGCTCGLAELEADELKNSNVVVLDGSQNGLTQEVAQSDKDRLLKAAQAAPSATSSCGSCYLGDAFRCASCPYLGLPAFKPGEKVQIDLGMDDI